jgi:hypothetical protein
MEKKKYVELTCRTIQLTHRTQLLAGSGSNTNPETTTPPNGIPDFDGWLE